MSVLSREALEASPLSDLHAIASEIGIDGFRRLRREDLVDAILERQGGAESNGNGDGAKPAATRTRSRKPRRTDEGDDDAEERPARSRSRRPAAA